jgi:molecular chaperone GrpE
MVSVLENLKRATETIGSGAKAEEGKLLEKMGEGIDLTIQELLGIFKKYNIARIDPLGQKFDHNLHQAVAQVEDDSAEPGTVLQVIQAGYVIADRLLRPAMVVVAKSSGDTAKKLDTTA